MWVVKVRYSYRDGPWSDWTQTVHKDQTPRAFDSQVAATIHLHHVRLEGSLIRGGFRFEDAVVEEATARGTTG